jgi:hypothetical protein
VREVRQVRRVREVRLVRWAATTIASKLPARYRHHRRQRFLKKLPHQQHLHLSYPPHLSHRWSPIERDQSAMI